MSGLAGVLDECGATLPTSAMDLAMTHRSYAYENGGIPTNERLEFLGDSVLGLVVTESLYRNYPDVSEGQLAKMRAAIVNARALADVARSLDLGAHLRLGKGEEITGGRDKSSILADTLEAVIGAVYLECGLATAEGLVRTLFDPLVARAATLGAGLDWKTSLQELTASLDLGAPWRSPGLITPRPSAPRPLSEPTSTARAKDDRRRRRSSRLRRRPIVP